MRLAPLNDGFDGEARELGISVVSYNRRGDGSAQLVRDEETMEGRASADDFVQIRRGGINSGQDLALEILWHSSACFEITFQRESSTNSVDDADVVPSLLEKLYRGADAKDAAAENEDVLVGLSLRAHRTSKSREGRERLAAREGRSLGRGGQGGWQGRTGCRKRRRRIEKDAGSSRLEVVVRGRTARRPSDAKLTLPHLRHNDHIRHEHRARDRAPQGSLRLATPPLACWPIDLFPDALLSGRDQPSRRCKSQVRRQGHRQVWCYRSRRARFQHLFVLRSLVALRHRLIAVDGDWQSRRWSAPCGLRRGRRSSSECRAWSRRRCWKADGRGDHRDRYDSELLLQGTHDDVDIVLL